MSSYTAKEKARYEANRESKADYYRQYHYGISPEQFTAILKKQGGHCAICKTPMWLLTPKQRCIVGHKNIQNTVKYTALSKDRFKDFEVD